MTGGERAPGFRADPAQAQVAVGEPPHSRAESIDQFRWKRRKQDSEQLNRMPKILREVIGGDVRTAIATRAAPDSTRFTSISAPPFRSTTTSTRIPAYGAAQR